MAEYTIAMGDVTSATQPIQKGRRMEAGFMKGMKDSMGDKKMKGKKSMFSKKNMKSKKSMGSRKMKMN